MLVGIPEMMSGRRTLTGAPDDSDAWSFSPRSVRALGDHCHAGSPGRLSGVTAGADLAVFADGRTLTTKEELDVSDGSSLATLVNVLSADLALRQGLDAAGLSPEEAATVRATEPPTLDAIDPTPADEVDSGRVTTALVTNIFLFLMIQTYGGWVLTAVTREKASRVVEVLLSVITPRQLLVGKLVGVGVVARFSTRPCWRPSRWSPPA
jgi:ABC-2 type transport system permease protein